MDKRTAREIIAKNDVLNNKQINVKIGTVENRDFPQTIYINISFWVKPNNVFEEYNKGRKFLDDKLRDILNNKLDKSLRDNFFFPLVRQNIYICSIPENFSYNNKPNFISLEVYLHTVNIASEKKFPLNAKKNTELFDECVKISNFIGDNLKEIETDFYINKSSKTIIQ